MMALPTRLNPTPIRTLHLPLALAVFQSARIPPDAQFQVALTRFPYFFRVRTTVFVLLVDNVDVVTEVRVHDCGKALQNGEECGLWKTYKQRNRLCRYPRKPKSDYY